MHRWPGLIAFVALFATISLLHRDALTDLYRFWNLSVVYDHGALLSAFVLVVFAFELAPRAAFVNPLHKGVLSGLLIFGALLVIATLATIMLGQMIFLPILLWFGVAAIYGLHAAKPLLWLLGALVFSWPVWDVLIGPLQSATIYANNALLDISRRTAYVEGDMVYLRHGSFVVERGCAGLNYLLTGLVLGSVYAYWFLDRLFHRLTAVVISAALSIIGNWLRVYSIVLAGDLSAMQHPLVTDHLWHGWVVFGLAMTPLFLFGRKLELLGKTSATESSGIERQHPEVGHLGNGAAAKQRLQRAVIVLLLLALPPLTVSALSYSGRDPAPLSAQLPLQVLDWQKSDRLPAEDFAPNFSSPAVSAEAIYVRHESEIHAWFLGYELTKSAPEMVGYPNSWYQRRQWSELPFETVSNVHTGSVCGPELLLLEGEQETRILMVGYVFENRLTACSLEAKAFEVLSKISGRDRAGAVVLSTNCGADCPDAVKILADFLTELHHKDLHSLWDSRDKDPL